MFERLPKKERRLYMKIRVINNGTLKDLFEKCREVVQHVK